MLSSREYRRRRWLRHHQLILALAAALLIMAAGYWLTALIASEALGQPPAPPENLKNWPRSCQQLHTETNRCENGLKSCDQRRVDYWRKRCEHDEPHGE